MKTGACPDGIQLSHVDANVCLLSLRLEPGSCQKESGNARESVAKGCVFLWAVLKHQVDALCKHRRTWVGNKGNTRQA